MKAASARSVTERSTTPSKRAVKRRSSHKGACNIALPSALGMKVGNPQPRG